jgi:uncharacterized membrane protein
VALLPSLGSSSSTGNSITDRGWVAGASILPHDRSRHAALWRGGRLVELRPLGGPNSSVAWPVNTCAAS